MPSSKQKIYIFYNAIFCYQLFLDTLSSSRKAKLKNTTKKSKRSNNNTLDSDEDPIMV